MTARVCLWQHTSDHQLPVIQRNKNQSGSFIAQSRSAKGLLKWQTLKQSGHSA